MKENTKYHNYRFEGKIVVDEVQPWFDFISMKPWDDPEIPWVLENRVRREILIVLSQGPKNFNEIYESIKFSPDPLLIKKDEHETKVNYQWTKETLENHLSSLEWHELIHETDGEYELAFPIFSFDQIKEQEKYVLRISEQWLKIIKQLKAEIDSNLMNLENQEQIIQILIENALEKLYSLLKSESILPDIPNIRTLWAEQLRTTKFEEWIEKNF